MGKVGVSYWGKLKAQNHLDFIVIACLRGIRNYKLNRYRDPELLGSLKMLPPTDTGDHILPGENAATGESVAEEPDFPKNPLDMASLKPQIKGPLRMIIRLGSNPRSEFVNGVPAAPVVPSILHPAINED